MAADIIRHPGASNVAVATDDIEDRFAITFAPAQPVLDAMAQLRNIRHFVAKRDQVDPNRNQLFGFLQEQIELIPNMATLRKAKKLFHEAETVPAPEEWLFLAIGVLLAAAPNSGKIPTDYTFGLIHSIAQDEDLHWGYDVGFSFAVIAKAVQEVRRTCKYVPSAQEFLEACDRQRRAFRKLGVDVDLMIAVREEAEAVIAEKAAAAERQRRWNAGWRPKGWTKEDEDMDIPF